MGKPRPIRNRKNEMISCWACVVFVALIYAVKLGLLTTSLSMIDYIFWGLGAVWIVIAIFYTIVYVKKKEDSGVREG